MLRLFRRKIFSGRKHFSWKTISFPTFGSDSGDKSNNNGGGNGGRGGGGCGGKFSDDNNGGGGG